VIRDNPKFYDAKCLTCHASKSAAVTVSTTSAPSLPLQKACPVSFENCTTCHMPKVELPGGHSVFNDHYIRVVRDGEKYPN
jgi:hypothetical protein